MTASFDHDFWKHLGVIATVRLEDAGVAREAVSRLVALRFPAVEITLTTPGALELFDTPPVDGVTLGAGTITGIDDARAVIDAGARFIVSPGTLDEVIPFCARRSIPYAPGVSTATEIVRARNLGARVVKLFPATFLGGPAGLRTFRGPFPRMGFVPTGGIDASECRAYLEAGALAVGVGGNLCRPASKQPPDWDEFERAARTLMDAARINV